MKGFEITPLSNSHDRKVFSCGIDSLDNYFHKQAGQDNRKRVAVTYVLHDQNNNKVAGYYTLSSTAIELVALADELRKKLPSYPCMPATLIGRLAIDKNYQKKGFGEIILIDALNRSHQASASIASFAVVVDTINRSAEKFYKKYGFLDLSSPKNRLFLPMKSLVKL